MRAIKETLLILVLLILILPSCKKERWKGKIYKENGVTVVENRSGGCGIRSQPERLNSSKN